MIARLMMAMFASLLLHGLNTAQNTCPHTRARTTPSTFQCNLFQDCGGIKFRIGEGEIDTGNDGCPLLAIYTPEHEIEEPATTRTKTEEVRLDDVKMISFRCERDWFLFIPLSTGCRLDRIVAAGVVSRLRTVGCQKSLPPGQPD